MRQPAAQTAGFEGIVCRNCSSILSRGRQSTFGRPLETDYFLRRGCRCGQRDAHRTGSSVIESILTVVPGCRRD